MMNSTILKTSELQDVAEWTKVFPKDVTENYTSSVTFMKQLTVVALSTITYLKNIFPEDTYTSENFCGIKLRILKKDPEDEFAQFVSNSLTRAFEAFDKKYLHQLVLCFYEDGHQPENLFEYHIFHYTYHGEEVSMSIHSKTKNDSNTTRCSFKDVKKSTIHMIRTCVVCMQSSLKEMPASFSIGLRLYYNEDAPDDYQAPGFTRATGEDHLTSTINGTLIMGSVNTPFHRMTARTYIKDSMDTSRDVNPSENPPVMTQCDTPGLSGSSRGHMSQSIEGLIRCPCNNYFTNAIGDSTELITCAYCKTKQHASCFGILNERSASVERHCCAECSTADPSRAPTDQQLSSMSLKQRQCLCIFRRTLQWCLLEKEMSSAFLEAKGVSPSGARRLLRLLGNHQLVMDEESDAPQKINKDKLKTVLAKFFPDAEETSIVDRLLAESLSSQESRPDPLSEVLGPMEQINLHKEATVGRTVEPETRPNIEDDTLKQYTAAVSFNPHNLPTVIEEVIINKEDKSRGKRKMDEPKFNLRSGVRIKKVRKTALIYV